MHGLIVEHSNAEQNKTKDNHLIANAIDGGSGDNRFTGKGRSHGHQSQSY